MRILTDIRKYNPDVIFLLENVEMGSKWEQVLSEAIGIFGVHINSALVSAQNRKRIYWTNIKTRTEGLFGELYSDIPQPEDRGILLKDILEQNVDEKYFLSDKMNTWLNKHPEKNENKGYGFGLKIKEENDKCSCLTSGQYKQNLSADYLCVAMRGRDGVQQLEPNNEGKTNCITTVPKDNLIFGCDYRSDEGIRIKEDGKSGTLRARARNDESCGQMVINQIQRIRRLTPLECSRLQTVPSWYIWECSETQQYKLLGNGWTIEVIKHILKELKNR